MSVPFTVGDALDESPISKGRVSFGGASLTLEFRPAQCDLSRKVVIDVQEFATCEFRRGLLADRLQLRTAGTGALGSVPGASLDEVTLHFSRRDREAAETLATRISTCVSDRDPYPFGLPLGLS